MPDEFKVLLLSAVAAYTSIEQLAEVEIETHKPSLSPGQKWTIKATPGRQNPKGKVFLFERTCERKPIHGETR